MKPYISQLKPVLTQRASGPQASGPCNLGMPNTSVYARYMWYLRLLTYNGFVVVIDNHLNSDPTITKSTRTWVKVCSAA